MASRLPDNGSVILGLTDPYSDIWIGYADVVSYWDKAPWEIVTPPADTVAETYAMRYGDEGRVLNLIKDSRAIYMNGLSSYVPDGWVNGRMDLSTTTFPDAGFPVR